TAHFAHHFPSREVCTSCLIASMASSSGLRCRREETNRQVARGTQSRGGTENDRDRIHRDTRRRNIPMRAPWNPKRNIRITSQRNCVRRIFRTDVHLKFHVNQFFAASESARNLAHARRLSRFDRQKLSHYFFCRNFWLNRFRYFVHGESQTV